MIDKPAVGSLVNARDREWVVLPNSDDSMLLVRPLDGGEDEVTGIYLPLEGPDIRPATFAWPDPTLPGDFRSCQLLRDAVRLGFRNSAGPFRSFAHINVEPRPYQLVPLLMALKLDPVRLLIADDVGIGKTIEAGLIARELLDRGEIQRMAVLCPPHLAEQWQAELASKFNILAELVTRSTVGRLERDTQAGQSLFDIHPHVIVSMDYIKLPRRRDEFIRSCPECVIVDEAHSCAHSSQDRGGRHLRHELLRDLARDPSRHLMLVTATPHSGDEGAFRSLLELLSPQFRDLPDDLTGPGNEPIRRSVAQHLVQRRRADVRNFMQADTPFPERFEREETYTLSPAYSRLFARVLDYAREQVQDDSGPQHRQRVRWWSALALLRSLASSPAAAEATMRRRSVLDDEWDDEDQCHEEQRTREIDNLGARAVLDLDDDETAEQMVMDPGAGIEEHVNARLAAFAREAHECAGPERDQKLAGATSLVRGLLDDGYSPILFCRFIATAEYVADHLRRALGDAEVVAVTGQLPPAEREERVRQLGQHAKRVLVATDCLSEGINLQEWFDAVMHYDLSWNPTRHEQREGRADRYGQPSPRVRTITYYGIDNQIDGLVLDVLLRKHRTIRTSLGISVPVPGSTQELAEAIRQGLLLRSRVDSRQLSLFGDGERLEALHRRWDNATEREVRSRTMFAQAAIHVQEVEREWQAVRLAMGTHDEARRFLIDAITTAGGSARQDARTTLFSLNGDDTLRDMIVRSIPEQLIKEGRFKAGFEMPVPTDTVYLTRTHPVIESVAAHVLDAALDPLGKPIARRCGVMRTRAVNTRTTLLLLRLRYHINVQGATPLLAEECRILAYEGSVDSLATAETPWLDQDAVERLLQAAPSANIKQDQASRFVQMVTDSAETLTPLLTDYGDQRASVLLEAHQGVRRASRQSVARLSVDSHIPDVLGVYVLLPD